MGSPNGRPNAMASVASDEAFLLMECIKKCAVQGRALKKNWRGKEVLRYTKDHPNFDYQNSGCLTVSETSNNMFLCICFL